MLHVYSSDLPAASNPLDSLFPPTASALQAILQRNALDIPLSKYLIVIAPSNLSSTSTRHALRRNTRAEYDDLGWDNLAGKLRDMDVACSGVLLASSLKVEDGADGGPLISLLSEVGGLSPRDAADSVRRRMRIETLLGSSLMPSMSST